MRISPLMLATCLCLAACATPAPPASRLDYLNARLARDGRPQLSQTQFAEQQQRYQRQQQEFEAGRLRNAGFPPAAEVQASGRSIVRAIFTEPRLYFRMPGVTIERLQDGRVLVTLSSDGRARTGAAPVPAAAYAELQELAAEAFRPDPPASNEPPPGWRRGDPLPPQPDMPPICHGWGVTLERIGPESAERVSAHGCDDSPRARARLSYAEKLAGIRADAIPGCAPSADQFYRLAGCFRRFDPATIDNR